MAPCQLLHVPHMLCFGVCFFDSAQECMASPSGTMPLLHAPCCMAWHGNNSQVFLLAVLVMGQDIFCMEAAQPLAPKFNGSSTFRVIVVCVLYGPSCALVVSVHGPLQQLAPSSCFDLQGVIAKIWRSCYF